MIDFSFIFVYFENFLFIMQSYTSYYLGYLTPQFLLIVKKIFFFHLQLTENNHFHGKLFNFIFPLEFLV